MENILIIILLVVVLIITFFIIPQWRMRRAVHQVIGIFRKYGTNHPSIAKTLEELGLRQTGGGTFSLFRRKDYKMYALDFLIKVEAVKQLEDGRLYLLEDRLLELKL